MFTGIVEEVGAVNDISIKSSSGTIAIKANKVLKDTHIGDSIAVNGVCLTVVRIVGNIFYADIMAETFRRSSLSILTIGSYVNLERAMAANGRFGGHIVSGHIDGVGKIYSITSEENAIWYTIEAKEEIIKYIVEKGSIAIDGISLTVANVNNQLFKVSIIPHTKTETILAYKKKGDIVNLECDIVGKYVEKLMGYNNKENSEKTKANSGLTQEYLVENGFI